MYWDDRRARCGRRPVISRRHLHSTPTSVSPRTSVTSASCAALTHAKLNDEANLPGVHGMSPSGPGAARRRSHGKIVLRVASREHEIRGRAYELYLARGAQPGRELEDWLQAERELAAEPRRAE